MVTFDGIEICASVENEKACFSIVFNFEFLSNSTFSMERLYLNAKVTRIVTNDGICTYLMLRHAKIRLSDLAKSNFLSKSAIFFYLHSIISILFNLGHDEHKPSSNLITL